MITPFRSEERCLCRRGKMEVHRTFHSNNGVKSTMPCFGSLEILDENSLPPGAGFVHLPHYDAEIVMYVRAGALACKDEAGRSVTIWAGEFEGTTTGFATRHAETRAVRAGWAHIYQIGLRASTAAGTGPWREQKRFSVAERRGRLRVVASPDARSGSLRLQQDALIYSGIFDPGQHVVHGLSQGRSAWVHIVQGEVALGDVLLNTGDGACVTAERAVSVTAQQESEILLVELGDLVLNPPGSEDSTKPRF